MTYVINEKLTNEDIDTSSLDESLLLEKTRQELINKSKSGRDYKDKSKGRNR